MPTFCGEIHALFLKNKYYGGENIFAQHCMLHWYSEEGFGSFYFMLLEFKGYQFLNVYQNICKTHNHTKLLI